MNQLNPQPRNRVFAQALLAVFLLTFGPTAQSSEVIYPFAPYIFHTTITGTAYGLLDVGHPDHPQGVNIPKDQTTSDVGALWGHLSTNSPYSPIYLATDSDTYQPYYTCENPDCTTGFTRTNVFHYSIKVGAKTDSAGLEAQIKGSSELRYAPVPSGPANSWWLPTIGPQINQEAGSELIFNFNSSADPDYISAQLYWSGSINSEWSKDDDGGNLNFDSWASISATDEDGTRTDKVDLQVLDAQGQGNPTKYFDFFEYVNGNGSIALSLGSRVTLDSFNSVIGGSGFDDASWATHTDFGYLKVIYTYKNNRTVNAIYSFNSGTGAPVVSYDGMAVQLPVPEPSTVTMMIIGLLLVAAFIRTHQGNRGK